MIAPSNLFSLLTKTLSNISQSFRLFVAGSIVGVYGLVLYEAFPRFLFDINYSLYYFILPVSVIVSVLVALPKFLTPKGDSIPRAQATTDDDPLLNQIITEGTQTEQPQTGTADENIDVSKIGGSNAELDALLAGGGPTETTSDTITTEVEPVAGMAAFDENKIREMIDQKFEPVEKDLTTFKKDLNKIKEDMKITKESVDTLTESFEGTLTDMKAFQAEISNPLNFMRKYFEALDLTNLSDPSLPLKQGILQTAQTNQSNSQTTNSQQVIPSQQIQSAPVPLVVQASGNNVAAMPQPSIPTSSQHPITRGSEMDNLVRGTDLDNPMNSVMKPLFSGNLSVANMMAIIELVGEMFAEKGDDCIDLLVEQCKLMGLKPEDEHTIYNIIDMLKNSGMSTDESISQLYRFAKIVGLNDKEADAYYARLNAQKRPKRDGRND